MAEVISILGNEVKFQNLLVKNAQLVQYLDEFEPSDYESAFVELIRIALDIRSTFTTDLETKNITKSAEEVIQRIDEHYQQIVDELEENLNKIIDPKDGSVIKAFQTVTGDNLKTLLAPEDSPDLGPIARLRSLISADLKGHQDFVSDSLEAITAKLRIPKNAKKSALDGTDFEAKVDKIIQDYARVFGDTAESTGATPEMGGAKKGDTKVTLNRDDTQGLACTLLWEAKTEKTFKSDRTGKVIDDQVKRELNAVISERNANAAVLVLDSELLKLEEQPSWREYDGNKLLIIVDTFNPEPELIRLAYLWGRWKSRIAIKDLKATVDVEGIRGSFEEMNLRLKDLRNVKKSHNDAIDNINNAGVLLHSFRRDLNNMMQELALMINVQIDEPEDDEFNEA